MDDTIPEPIKPHLLIAINADSGHCSRAFVLGVGVTAFGTKAPISDLKELIAEDDPQQG